MRPETNLDSSPPGEPLSELIRDSGLSAEQLGKVLTNEVALRLLKATGDPHTAYLAVVTPEQRFAKSLIDMYNAGEGVLACIDAADTGDPVTAEIIRRIVQISSTINKIMNI